MTSPSEPTGLHELRVMSFNLRYADHTPPNSWPRRRPVVRGLLSGERPHLLGTQEGLHQQLRDIGDDLPDTYAGIGRGRDGGSHGEAMHIFFDTARLGPLERGHYWLSDTPDVPGSKTWGGCCPRMLTWIRFLDRSTGGQFYALNTHLEAFDADARTRAADLILHRMAADLDPSLPVVVTGDFNEPAATGGTVYDRLVTDGPLRDAWAEARSRGRPYGTFHNFRPLDPGGERIDWVLTTADVRTHHARLNTYRQDGQYPSDHLPVQVVLTLPAT